MKEIFTAVETGRIAQVKKMLTQEPGLIRARDDKQNTLLHQAAACGYGEIVKSLIEAGAEIDARNRDGKTALDRAAEEGHHDAARMLLESGAACDFLLAIRYGAVRRVAAFLAQGVSTYNSGGYADIAAIQVAMLLCHKPVAKALLSRQEDTWNLCGAIF